MLAFGNEDGGDCLFEGGTCKHIIKLKYKLLCHVLISFSGVEYEPRNTEDYTFVETWMISGSLSARQERSPQRE